MAWISLTEADIKGRLSGPEYSALTTAARSGVQTAEEIIAQAIEDSTNRVRGYVAACLKNTLGEAGTIPEELKNAALALVRNFLFTRLPGMKDLNDETRQEEMRQAVQELRDAAACKFAIVQPITEGDQAAGTAIEEVSSRERIAKRTDLNGLV